MIEVQNLTKNYGDKKALDNISFCVKKGEILGFLGPNGAGKSTTMNILTGFISYTSGTVKIDGMDIMEEPIRVKSKIGYLPELPPLYTDMTVDEYLDFVYDLKKLPKDGKKAHIDEVLDEINIADVRTRLIRNLSKGYRQRVGLAGALIGKPEVLILDEPTVGLDPNQIIEIRNLIRKIGENHTVILSSHILSEISAVCNRIMIINKGKIVAEDTPENLEKRLGEKNTVILRLMGEKDAAENVLKNIDGVAEFEVSTQEDGILEARLRCDRSIDNEFNRSLFFEFAKNDIAIITHTESKSTLEDIFLLLIRGEGEIR